MTVGLRIGLLIQTSKSDYYVRKDLSLRTIFMTCMVALHSLQTGKLRRGRAQEDQALPLRRPL